MAIMDAFRTAVPTGPQVVNGNPVPAKDISTTLPNNATVPNGVSAAPAADANTRNDPANPSATPASESPLEAFKDLWQNGDTGAAADNPGSMFAIDREKLATASKQFDFSKSASPELVTKALGGDANAMAEVLNSVGQSALLEATVVNTNIIEQALKRADAINDKKMADKFRTFQVNENLSQNSLFTNPAAQPIVSSVAAQIAAKNPGASAAEIKSQTEKYLNDFASEILGKGTTADTNTSSVPKEFDFSQFELAR